MDWCVSSVLAPKYASRGLELTVLRVVIVLIAMEIVVAAVNIVVDIYAGEA